MILHSFWRSLATYRIRIALNLKGVAPPHEITVDLDAGDQHAPTYRAINPMGAVPALVLDDGTTLTQSLAILEWIEETYPTPATPKHRRPRPHPCPLRHHRRRLPPARYPPRPEGIDRPGRHRRATHRLERRLVHPRLGRL